MTWATAMPRRKLGWPFGALGACLAVQAVGHAACDSRTDPSTNAHWSGGIAMTGGARIKAAMTTVNGTLSLRSIADLPSAYPATNRRGGMRVWLVFRSTGSGLRRRSPWSEAPLHTVSRRYHTGKVAPHRH